MSALPVTPVEFYFDPACPWTWITSRWVAEVAAARSFSVGWRTFSLWHHNEWVGTDMPEQYRSVLEAQFRALRVIEAARVSHGEAGVGALYTEFGARIHHDGDAELAGLADAVVAAGLPATLLDAAEDPAWDAVIDASTRRGSELVGADVGVPIIAVDGGRDRSTFFGPVLSPAPTGDAALRLWDTYLALGEFDGLFEIKRSRSVGPQFGPRPT